MVSRAGGSSRSRVVPTRAFRRRGRFRAMWSLLGSAWKARGSRRLLLVVVLMLVLAVLAKAASVAVGSLLYSGL